MKKLILTLFILGFVSISHAQTTPTQQQTINELNNVWPKRSVYSTPSDQAADHKRLSMHHNFNIAEDNCVLQLNYKESYYHYSTP